MHARLALKNIHKRYPAVVANQDISLSVKPGEIHAVLGENGAGKSTLMKIIYGVVKADSGEIWMDGQAIQVANPQEARKAGISMVFQHFSLFDTLSVAENVWLGLDKSFDLKEVSTQITAKATLYGLDVDPNRPVHTLSVGERQRVEIIRALLTNPKILILDEPTSVLTPQAVEKLFVVLRQLSKEGCSILYISHKLDEIRALCDSCTVLRGGQVTGVCIPAQETNASLGRMMIGSEPPALQRQSSQLGASRLVIDNLSKPKSDPFGVDLNGIQLDIRSGEIVGIAGVSGNGQRELLACIAEQRFTATGQQYKVHMVPEERLGCGAVPSLSLADNLLLTRDEALIKRFGLQWIRPHVLQAQATHIIRRFGVKAGGPNAAAQSLSGGNLQKFIVGREIDANPDVLVVAQPTWGVDVGAAAQIHAEMLRLRQAGCALLVISDELEELFVLCDRLHVMAKGRLSPSIATTQASPEMIGEWMSGLWQAANADSAPFADVPTPTSTSMPTPPPTANAHA